MAQVKATHLQANGMQVNMSDSDTLRQVLRPSSDDDVSNKVYTDESDLAVTIAAQDANDALEERLDADISNLNTALTGEILARQTADQAIIDSIESGGPDGSNTYVKRSGDDMTGNLTLGTDKITLNASDGSATFEGDVNADAVVSNDASFAGEVRVSADDTAAGQYYWNQTTHQGVAIGTGFVATARKGDNPLFVNFIDLGASNQTDLMSRWVANGGAADGGVDLIDFKKDGSASFSGAIEAASIDGGTY